MKTGGLHITTTGENSGITIGQDGHIVISGRFWGNKFTETTDELLNQVEKYISDPAGEIILDFHIEYLEAIKSPFIITAVRKLMQVSQSTGKLEVNWYYEEGDDDMLEQGEYISWAAGHPFNFIMIPA